MSSALQSEVVRPSATPANDVSIPAFNNYAAMLAESDAEAVVISTPSGLHPRHGIMAVLQGRDRAT